MDLRSPLAKAKGIGSAKNASHHWWMQRVSAVALVPLAVWFVSSLLQASEQHNLLHMLRSPFHAAAMILFFIAALYHGSLGMKVIYEDYIKCKCSLTILVILTNFISAALAVFVILAILQVHLGKGAFDHLKRFQNKSKYNHHQQPL